MHDDSSLNRRMKLILLLSSRRFGVTLKEMSDEFAVNSRTILRDMQSLSSAGLRIESETFEYGCKRWRLLDNTRLTSLKFTKDEAAAISLAMSSFQSLAGTHFWKSARSASQKVRLELGEELLVYIDRLGRMFHDPIRQSGCYLEKGDVLDALARGYEEMRVVRMTYQSMKADAPRTRDVHPLSLARYKEMLYLIAFAPEHQEIRRYKVDRVDSAQLCDDHFEPQPDFDPAKHLADSFGMHGGEREVVVRVQFTPEVARYVRETTRHPSSILTALPDGGLIVQFTLTTTVEIKSWILSFGQNALVLEPPELRDEIVTILRDRLAAYAELSNQLQKETKE